MWLLDLFFLNSANQICRGMNILKYFSPLDFVIKRVDCIVFALFKFDATRYMYIIVEAPELVIRGEQIGVRVTVFNYWYNDDYLEVSTVLILSLLTDRPEQTG